MTKKELEILYKNTFEEKIELESRLKNLSDEIFKKDNRIEELENPEKEDLIKDLFEYHID